MKIDVNAVEDGIVISINGVMKKAEAKELADELETIGRTKPKKLALDCSSLAAVAFDAMPYLVSAIERLRLGKANVRAVGCNNVVERTFRGSDFERVATLG